jgi:magnesium transporter
MAPDIAADLLGALETEDAERMLNTMSRRQSERLTVLLRYADDSVGGIMTNDLLTLSANLTVINARELLSRQLSGPDFTEFIYIVADEESRRLVGVVSLREFMMARDEAVIEQIMTPYLLTLSPLQLAKPAAYDVMNSSLAALPVIGSDNQLLGAVTADVALAQVAPASFRRIAPRIFS